MVARGAGTAGPVLLACPQWDSLGLARRLPSLGIGAWGSVPLPPWRVQCPVRVCAALAAGSGGSGRYLVLCLSCFPLPAPRVPRCVWRAVPSGCPLPSLAGKPFHAVCAFLRARSGCPSGSPCVRFACVCARAPAASAPPPLGGVACAPRAVPALGAGRAVPRGPCPSACPAPVSCSVWRAWGGAVRSRFPDTWLGIVGVVEGCPRGGCLPLLRGASGVRRSPSPDCPPTGRAVGVRYTRAVGAGVRVWGPYSVPFACTPCGGCVPRGGSLAFLCRGAGLGGGGVRRAPHSRGRGGAVGRGVAVPRSVPLPSLGRQLSGCHWRRSVHGGPGPPYHSDACSPAFTGRDLCGVLARWRGLACSPRFLWEPAAGAGGRAAPRLLSRAGGGGTIPPASGGGGRRPRGLRASGGGGGGGGSRRGLPAPPLGGGPWYPILAPLVPLAHSPPACACGRGRGAAPGLGGMRRGPWTAPPGAPADLNPPPALPEWAVVMGGSWGAGPPYCSGAPPCAAPKLGPRVAPARWCGLACRPRPPREQAAGGAGARGVQVQPHPPPPPPASRSLLGEGGRPLGSGGGGGSLLWLLSWGGGGGGWGGRSPAPLPRRASACHPLSPACPPGVYSCRGGCRTLARTSRRPAQAHRGGGPAAAHRGGTHPLTRTSGPRGRCPSLDPRAPAGPHIRCAPVARVRALTPTRRRLLQSPQHHATPTGGWAGTHQGPPQGAGGGRPGPGGGRGGGGTQSARCRTV